MLLNILIGLVSLFLNWDWLLEFEFGGLFGKDRVDMFLF